MNIFMRLLGIVVALLAATLTKYFLGVSVSGTAWNVNLFFTSIIFDSSMSSYAVFAVIYEVGRLWGGLEQNKSWIN